MKKIISLACCLIFFAASHAQVSAVEFGKNRVQYQKFKWRYYQTDNFNVYFSEDGLELGKYVAQVAERELPGIEEFVEYGLQRRANIIVYNNFDEYQQSNIGLGIDWQNTGGVTKLVNNKMVVYFDGNHDSLRLHIRQGLARVLVENVLFGDDLGEFAANQALLDLPKWLTDGYISYAAQNWSTALDDQAKSALLSGDYNNFYQFAFEKPTLAGHAFWHWFGAKYGVNKTTYLLYLSRIYRNLNSASQKVAKKKFKKLLQDFMTEESQKYFKDIRGRRNVPKGQLSIVEEIGKKDFIRFNANPAPRSFTYAVVEFRQGQYRVVVNENMVNRIVLLKYGVRANETEQNPNYPILAWDGKGQRLACIYWKEGKLRLFVYDMVARIKTVKDQELHQFDQVQDMKYMLDANTLLLSAVKSGQSDIFVYKIDKGTAEQVTNDVYDDLDASFVAFPNKTGIIFASNRPNATAVGTSDSLPVDHFNIFLVDNWNKSEFKQISQLTNVRFGNARYPSQYNTTHFTFVSDENGINNRYAGFFKTERAGLDTLVFIGDEVLRNPERKEVDSLLKEWNKTDVDSVGFVSVTNDSTYVFPLTNYQSGLLETRTAGDNTLVSEITRQGNFKFLYRLKVDENTLRRRNVTSRPTEYVKRLMDKERIESEKDIPPGPMPIDSSAKKEENFFQNEFEGEKKDSTKLGQVVKAEEIPEKVSPLKKWRLFEYRPPKFFIDYAVTGFNNSTFGTRYQTYTNSTGPITLSNGDDFNGLVRMGTSDLFEDVKFSGGFRLATSNLSNYDVLFSFMNYRKRLDWGAMMYRTNEQMTAGVIFSNDTSLYNALNRSNLYLINLQYPFNKVRSIRAKMGVRLDKFITKAEDDISAKVPDEKKTYSQFNLEYVHDNTLNPALNIWKGLRWKVYFDWYTQISKVQSTEGKFLLNGGFDARHYLPIYRNVIWAVRAAGDFSWGNQKVIYYLGGVDGWVMFGPNEKTNGETRYFDNSNPPDPKAKYAYQSLAINLRGFKQNIAHGNNAIVINSEVRAPVFATLLNKPINNAFIRNFQLVQFIDLGTAWDGNYNQIERPSVRYGLPPITVKVKPGGLGPFAGGYGFGARSTLLGYFFRFDAAWQMNGLFRGKPMYYFAMGLDF
ncbi:MAG: hypothetical protein C4308_01785 [Chitinophagaceae bacterium]